MLPSSSSYLAITTVLLWPSLSALLAQKPFFDFSSFPVPPIVPHAIPIPDHLHHVPHAIPEHRPGILSHHHRHLPQPVHLPARPKPLSSLRTFPKTSSTHHVAPFHHFSKVPHTHTRTHPRPKVQTFPKSHVKPASFVNLQPITVVPALVQKTKKTVIPMEVMELVKSSNSESDVEMTPFVNL